jgi:hypothetical protein
MDQPLFIFVAILSYPAANYTLEIGGIDAFSKSFGSFFWVGA